MLYIALILTHLANQLGISLDELGIILLQLLILRLKLRELGGELLPLSRDIGISFLEVGVKGGQVHIPLILGRNLAPQGEDTCQTLHERN